MDRVRAARAAIEERLGASPAWRRAGEWRVMGYNSPMIPEAKRLYEIQLPVARSTDG
jgi:hypothetical protein